MSDHDMIRRKDALQILDDLSQVDGCFGDAHEAIAALPAVTVPVVSQPVRYCPICDIADCATHREPVAAPATQPHEYCPSMDPNDMGDCIYCGNSRLAHDKTALTPTQIDDSHPANPAVNAHDPACDHCGMDPAAIREAALREAADLVNRRVDGVRVSIPCPDGKSGCLVHHFRIEDGPTAKAILALLEKPHDRA